MKNLVKAAAAATAIAGTIAGGSITHAEVGSTGDLIKYRYCSSAKSGNKISETDNLGSQTSFYTLKARHGDLWCGDTVFRVTSGAIYLSAMISNSNASYVSCRIYDNGALVARSVDNSEYGAIAVC